MEQERTHVALVGPTAEIEILTRKPQVHKHQEESNLKINTQHILACDDFVPFSGLGQVWYITSTAQEDCWAISADCVQAHKVSRVTLALNTGALVPCLQGP